MSDNAPDTKEPMPDKYPDWKWEYENLCGFATDYENRMVKAEARVKELEALAEEAVAKERERCAKIADEKIRCGLIPYKNPSKEDNAIKQCASAIAEAIRGNGK
jgi:hypothetical protein